MNKPLYAYSSSTAFQRRCLLFIEGVTTITQMIIEYAYIYEEIEEINAAGWVVKAWGYHWLNVCNSQWGILQLFVCKDKP